MSLAVRLVAVRRPTAVLAARRCVCATAPLRADDSHDPYVEYYKKLQRHPEDYRPGTSSYAYRNPWPMINKGRLDALFSDGWRRPPAREQGAFLRRNWIPFGFDMNDEHEDWLRMHLWCFCFITVLLGWFTVCVVVVRPDWPYARDWAQREAYFEMERRERLGLAYISADVLPRDRVEATLPSEQELGDFQILV